MPAKHGKKDLLPGSPAPKRQLLVQKHVLDRIRSGRFTDRLPGIQKLAGDIGVNARTVHKAILDLVAQGQLYQVPRSGTYVRSAAAQPGRRRRPVWTQTLHLGYSDVFNIGPALHRAMERALGANRNKVELVNLGFTFEEYARSLRQIRQLGRPLDVLLIAPAWLDGVVADLEPLDRFSPDLAKRVRTETASGVEAAFRVDGALVGAPLVFSPTMWTVNEQLCAKAGLPIPARGWTWSDFAATCAGLARASGHYGVCLPNDFATWIPFIRQNGGEVFDRTSGRVLLGEPPALEALAFVLDLIRGRKTALGVLGPRTRSLDLFERGALGMFAANYYPGHEPRVPFLWRRVPPPVGKREAVFFHATGLAVHRHCRAPEEAAALLEALTGEAAQAEFAFARCALPAHREVLRARRLAAMEPREADEIAASLSHAEFAAWGMSPDLTASVARETDLLWMGVTDLKSFARKIEEMQQEGRGKTR